MGIEPHRQTRPGDLPLPRAIAQVEIQIEISGVVENPVDQVFLLVKMSGVLPLAVVAVDDDSPLSPPPTDELGFAASAPQQGRNRYSGGGAQHQEPITHLA
jgi:hypothetical protein